MPEIAITISPITIKLVIMHQAGKGIIDIIGDRGKDITYGITTEVGDNDEKQRMTSTSAGHRPPRWENIECIIEIVVATLVKSKSIAHEGKGTMHEPNMSVTVVDEAGTHGEVKANMNMNMIVTMRAGAIEMTMGEAVKIKGIAASSDMNGTANLRRRTMRSKQCLIENEGNLKMTHRIEMTRTDDDVHEMTIGSMSKCTNRGAMREKELAQPISARTK